MTARREPASAAARLAAPAEKNVAHSASSGATSVSSTQAFFWRRPRVGWGRARAASSAAAARSAASRLREYCCTGRMRWSANTSGSAADIAGRFVMT